MRIFLIILAIFACSTVYAAGHLPANSGSMVLRSGSKDGMAPGQALPDVTGSSQFLHGFDFVKEEIRQLRKDRQPPADFGKYVGRIPPSPAKAAASVQRETRSAPVQKAPELVARPGNQPYGGMQSPYGQTPVFDFAKPSQTARMPAPQSPIQQAPVQQAPVQQAPNPQYAQMKPYAKPAPLDMSVYDSDFGYASAPIITPESIRRGQTPVEPRIIYVPDQKPVQSAESPNKTQKPYAKELPPGMEPPVQRPVSMLARPGDPIPDDAPPVEEIDQGEWVMADDPYITKKDVSNIPFALKKNERPVFYFSPYNSDSKALWRDIRQNHDVAALMEEGKIEVLQPVWTSHDIPPAVIFAWLLTFNLPAALDFMDFEASMPEGWLDVANAAYLSENERNIRLDHYLGLMEQWLIDRQIDAEDLFIDRGVQMGLARKINKVNDGFLKLTKDIDKHPAIFVNGKRKEGYFEELRTIPMEKR